MRSCTINTTLTAIAMSVLFLGAEVISQVQPPSPEQAQVVKAVAPAYPVIAIAADVGGTVTIEVQIDVRGLVTAVRAVDGPKLLRAAAEITARRWIFSSVEDQTKARVVRLLFAFKLMPKDTPQDELLPIFMPPYQVEVRQAKGTLIHRVDSDPPGYVKPQRPSKRKH